jgi:hypothetical protein
MSTILNDNSLYANNKLGLINQCLISISQRPLAEGTLIENLAIGSAAKIASDIISNVTRDVLTKGWYFNTDFNFPFYPDSTGFIIIPPFCLRIDVGNTNLRGKVVLKGNRFYNRTTFSYVFKEPIKADVVWLMEYEMIPFQAYQYIAIRSARLFQTKLQGSSEITQQLLIEEQEAYDNLMREELQFEDFNLLNGRITNRYNFSL